jgi:hypothetical protein
MRSLMSFSMSGAMPAPAGGNTAEHSAGVSGASLFEVGTEGTVAFTSLFGAANSAFECTSLPASEANGCEAKPVLGQRSRLSGCASRGRLSGLEYPEGPPALPAEGFKEAAMRGDRASCSCDVRGFLRRVFPGLLPAPGWTETPVLVNVRDAVWTMHKELVPRTRFAAAVSWECSEPCQAPCM